MNDVFGPKVVRVINNLFFYFLFPYTLFLIFGLTLSKEQMVTFSELHRFMYNFDYITALFLMIISGIYYYPKFTFGSLTLLSGVIIVTIGYLLIAADTYKEFISNFPVVFLICTLNLISIVYVLHVARIAEIKVYRK